jgi:hypothetical protein
MGFWRMVVNTSSSPVWEVWAYVVEHKDESAKARMIVFMRICFLGIVVVCLQIYELFSIRLVEDEKKIRKFVGLP